MTDRALRLVLDTSAMLSFVRQQVDVGELLAELSDADAIAGLPLACLVDASMTAVDRDRLELLANHPATVILGADEGDWRVLAELCALTGQFSTASAAMAALDAGCWVVSARPWLYEQIGDGQLAIGVDD
ncbi:MAG TPA: hypothetical protein VI172_14045 [Candidatus Dormibacteraeota bacterium]